MAQRRMFSLHVVDTDKFLDLSVPARLLYYELGMHADDDGFVGNPKTIVRTIGCCYDDLEELISNEYLIRFDSGVVVIRHWKMNNYIQNDRYNQTVYLDEYDSLTLEGNIYEEMPINTE